jgi:protein-histidine pros-kinase
MKLRAKFNLVLLAVFVLGLLATGFVSYTMLHRNARDEVIQNAGIMMEAALAVRGYTLREIKPLLELQLRRAFLPQSVSAFAATQTFAALRTRYPDYTYKEAALNPTNPQHRVTDWEADIVSEFRHRSEKTEIIGERDTPTGRMLYLARPIQIKDEGCLTCHSTPEVAPETMVKIYGTANGFGWKMQEIIGAQIVSVPMTVPIAKADTAFRTFMGSLIGIFLLLFVVVNLMLHFIIIRPLAHMAQTADTISTGDLSMPELVATGKDEVAVLARSFNRLRRSLEKALQMMGE